jgi:hypothetical protein
MLAFSTHLEYPIVHVPLISVFSHFTTPLAQFNPMSSHPPDTRYSFLVAAKHPVSTMIFIAKVIGFSTILKVMHVRTHIYFMTSII